ncbi:MAG: hypothetical protein GF308_01245 [Candidatus Heimdallarchaeota archaeon]|nr:hypothetical protein [Candidatus Heimdallarchaeota archaeon]
MAIGSTDIIMIVGIVAVFALLIAALLWNQLRGRNKESRVGDSAYASPSSFESEQKTKMMSKIDKRQSQLRRERILEGGTLPELQELVIYSPEKNERISSTEVDVRGKSAIKSIVWVNNRAAFVDVDGSFIGTIPLTRGRNDVEILAIGPYGRTVQTQFRVVCTAQRGAESTSLDSILPEAEVDFTTISEEPDTFSVADREEAPVQRDSTQQRATSSSDVSPVVPETEIDPSVLEVLKKDVLAEESSSGSAPSPPSGFSIPQDDLLEPSEEMIAEIPPIPILDEDLPRIPDVVEVEDETFDSSPVLEVDEETLEDSVKIIEEVVDVEEEETEEAMEEETEEAMEEEIEEEETEASTVDEEIVMEEESDSISLQEIVPETLGNATSDRTTIDADTTKDEKSLLETEDLVDSEIGLEDFEPLQQKIVGTKELSLESDIEKLEDDRYTTIIQHTGSITLENGSQLPVLKIEKRIEKIDQRWYSTLGIVNVSGLELSKVIIEEFITGTMKITDTLPTNVMDPAKESLPEGVRVIWQINCLKPQMKAFITYDERVNSLELVPEELQIPTIKIRIAD